MSTDPLRILVVDDDEAFAQVLGAMLSDQGYACQSITQRDAIVSTIESSSFDVLLLDLMMGEESTMPLIPEISEMQPDLKIVVLTGYASVSSTVQALKLGAENYLAKPVGIRDVIAILEEAGTSSGEGASEAAELKPMSLQRVEWEHIQRVLAEHDGNISATARALGLHRRTLQRKLEKRPRS